MEGSQIRPYQFEPRVTATTSSNHTDSGQPLRLMDTNTDSHLIDNNSSSDSESDDMSPDEADQPRIGNTEWCTCDHCQALPTSKECICCQELVGVGDKIEGIPCITQHHDFSMLCLHPAVLRVAIVARNDLRRDNLQEPLSNE